MHRNVWRPSSSRTRSPMIHSRNEWRVWRKEGRMRKALEKMGGKRRKGKGWEKRKRGKEGGKGREGKENGGWGKGWKKSFQLLFVLQLNNVGLRQVTIDYTHLAVTNVADFVLSVTTDTTTAHKYSKMYTPNSDNYWLRCKTVFIELPFLRHTINCYSQHCWSAFVCNTARYISTLEHIKQITPWAIKTVPLCFWL